MATFIMYSVKDEMTGKFMNPMFCECDDIYKDTCVEASDRLATRQFKSNVNNIQLWKDNPNDYSLYRVGYFDDEAGAMASKIEKVSSGRSVLNV